jgi:hypothetical protein
MHPVKRATLVVFSLLASLAVVIPASTVPAQAAFPVPEHVTFTLEGCRGSAGLFPANGPFICPDSFYTTGNLGSGWNELDRVPHRLTTSLGSQTSATTSYQVALVADNLDAGHPGYDRLTAPTTNASLSAASCAISDVTPAPDLATGEKYVTGFGGIDRSIYRIVQITQNKGTTCVFDWNERLALGSHLFPGSSLHTNAAQADLTTGGIGARDVSIPVKEIQPQTLTKTETAKQGVGNNWSVTKTVEPASISFNDTCDTNGSRESGNITIKVDVDKTVQNGDIVVRAAITATNPSHRPINVTVTDEIFTGAIGSTTNAGGTDTGNSSPGTGDNARTFTEITIAANTARTLIHEISVPDGTGSTFSDSATGDYEDPVEPDVVLGSLTTTAQADVSQLPEGGNASVVVTDLESLGDGTSSAFEYKVVSTGSATGTYTYGDLAGGTYTLNGYTQRPVLYTSGSISDDTTLTFIKKVRLAAASGGVDADDTLDDTATIVGDNDTTLSSDSKSIAISAAALSSLTVSKKIPFVLGTGESVAFTFNLFADGADPTTDTPIDFKTITFNAGDGGNTAKTATFTGLDPNTNYDLYEVAPTGWVDPGKIDVKTAALPSCGTTTNLTNSFSPAAAKVKKITDPSGSEANWKFTLTGPGSTNEEVTTSDADFKNFLANLTNEGTYTITETQKTGWDLTDIDSPDGTKSIAAATCSFTVNFPADLGRVFSCTFTNTQRGKVHVDKLLNGNPLVTGDPSFTFELRKNATADALVNNVVVPGNAGTLLETKVASPANGGSFTFAEDLVADAHYQICELVLPGWSTDLGPNPFNLTILLDNVRVCVDFTVDPGATKTFTVNNTPPPGGEARTIGFWKNWTSCDGKGKQAWILDQTLFLAGSGGISVGDLVLYGGATLTSASPDCLKAIRILNKSTINTGTKKAKDPAFNLAAQLLAAKLNIVAGAGSCTAANTAIASAQALLDLINFTGITHASMTSAQKTQANNLAHTLDLYNNNLLC